MVLGCTPLVFSVQISLSTHEMATAIEKWTPCLFKEMRKMGYWFSRKDEVCMYCEKGIKIAVIQEKGAGIF